MIRLDATGDPAAVLDAVDEFVRTVVDPLEADHADELADPRRRFDATGRYAALVLDLKREVRTRSADKGLYTIFTPRELGGAGGDPLLCYRVWERLYHTCGPDRLLPYDTVAHLTGGPSVAFAEVGDDVRHTMLPALLRGEAVLCVGQTEAPGSRPTVAEADGDRWTLSGTKHWVSRAPFADLALVYAITDPGPADGPPATTAFLVPTDAPGFHVEPVVPLFGRAGGEEATVTLDEVRVSGAQVIGTVHGGASVAARTTPYAAMFTAGRFVGLARWALTQTLDTVAVAPPGPGATVPLADSAIEVYAAHRLAVDCGRRLVAGEDATTEMALTRTYANEVCARAYDRCMQAQGPRSLTSAAHLFDGWHQSRIVLHADAGAAARKWAAARRVIAGDVPFD